MSCCLIPVSFKSWSVSEIITCTETFLIEYEGNPEKYDIPNMKNLNTTILKAIDSFEYSSNDYRKLVLEKMNINNISMHYLNYLNDIFC